MQRAAFRRVSPVISTGAARRAAERRQLFGEDGNGHAGVENPTAQVGNRDLPVPHVAQAGFVDKTATGYRRIAAYRLGHA